LRASAEGSNVDYVANDHSQVINSAVSTFTTTFRSRPWKQLKVDADFMARRVNDRPFSAPIPGVYTNTLVWREVDRTRVRGSYTPNHAQYGITAGWMIDRRSNPDQDTHNGIITRDATAWWSIAPKLTTTASAMNQSFGLRGLPGVTAYQTDSRSWTFGTTWQPSRKMTVNASFTRSDASGSIAFRQDTFAAALSHDFKAGRLRLGMTLDNLTDFNGTGLGYDTNLLFAEFSTSLR